MCTDPARALAFYQALFGWTTRTMPMGEGAEYTMLHVGDEGIGGVVPLDASHGVPSHWIGYVTVPDVDAACERTAELGGTVCVPATDIPNVGRFAVIEDPTGAIISPFRALPGQDAPERTGAPPAGTFIWEELLTSDPERAMPFHAGVFGWRYDAVDMGPMGTYWLGKRGDTETVGLMQLPAEARTAGARSHWLSYVNVESVDDAAARAGELGATVLVPPHDVPDVGRFAVLRDPVGALFAVYRPLHR
jgi:predicted enzyme related to lactoylglutathione lyase